MTKEAINKILSETKITKADIDKLLGLESLIKASYERNSYSETIHLSWGLLQTNGFTFQDIKNLQAILSAYSGLGEAFEIKEEGSYEINNPIPRFSVNGKSKNNFETLSLTILSPMLFMDSYSDSPLKKIMSFLPDTNPDIVLSLGIGGLSREINGKIFRYSIRGNRLAYMVKITNKPTLASGLGTKDPTFYSKERIAINKIAQEKLHLPKGKDLIINYGDRNGYRINPFYRIKTTLP